MKHYLLRHLKTIKSLESVELSRNTEIHLRLLPGNANPEFTRTLQKRHKWEVEEILIFDEFYREGVTVLTIICDFGLR